MSLDHRSTRSSAPLMNPVDSPESTLRQNAKMKEALFRTAHTDVNDDNEDASAFAKPLNREGVEDGNDAIQPKMQQTETQRWLKARYRSAMSSRATKTYS